MNALGEAWFAHGLWMYGHFDAPNTAISPVMMQFGLLASHPTLLRQTAHAVASVLAPTSDRLFAIADGLPLATAVSLAADVPLLTQKWPPCADHGSV